MDQLYGVRTIKKILKCFVEDYTSTETSNFTKLNRKTVSRYYNIFRKISVLLIIKKLKLNPREKEFLGYIKGEYGPKGHFKVYKINKKTFLCLQVKEKPNNAISALHDKDFNKFLGFLYKRFSKFYGLTGQVYYYQLFESVLKYNYTEEGLFNIIWEHFAKKPKVIYALYKKGGDSLN